MVRQWSELPHPRGTFRRDITDGRQISWPYYVQARSWAANFAQNPVEKFEVAWHSVLNTAVFVGTCRDGAVFTVNPRAGSQAREFRWGDQDISHM